MGNKYDFNVEFPNSEERKNSIDFILEQSYIQKNKSYSRLKSLFVGPGFDIIFYRSKLLIVISIILYLFASIVGHISVREVISSEYLVLLLFPIMNVAFFSLSIWSEEQSEIIELKKTLKYTQSYIITLRMFYVSLITVGVNEMVVWGYVDKSNYSKMAMLAFTFSFIFSLLSLWFYDLFDNYYNIIFLCIVWIIGGMSLFRYGEAIINLALNTIPIVAYVLLATLSLVLFIRYLGKVEKCNAYA